MHDNLIPLIYLEKESSTYAEVSLEETPIKSLSNSGLRSPGSIRHENSSHQTATTIIKADDAIIPTTFT